MTIIIALSLGYTCRPTTKETQRILSFGVYTMGKH